MATSSPDSSDNAEVEKMNKNSKNELGVYVLTAIAMRLLHDKYLEDRVTQQ